MEALQISNFGQRWNRGVVGLSVWSPGTGVRPQAGTLPDRPPVQIPRSFQPQHQNPCCPQNLCIFLRGCRVTGPAPPHKCLTPGQDRPSVGLTEPERAGYDQPGFRCWPELWPGGSWGPKLWGCEGSGVAVPCHVL